MFAFSIVHNIGFTFVVVHLKLSILSSHVWFFRNPKNKCDITYQNTSHISPMISKMHIDQGQIV